MSLLALTFPLLCNEILCGIFDYPLRIFLLSRWRYVCFYYWLIGWNNIVLLNTCSGIMFWVTCIVTSVCNIYIIFWTAKVTTFFRYIIFIQIYYCLSFKSYHYWCWMYYICWSKLNSFPAYGIYIWVYYWYNYPIFNVLKLYAQMDVLFF